MRRLAGIVVAFLVATGIVGVSGEAARAEIVPPSGGDWVELFNPLLPLVGGKYHVCLDVPGGTTQNHYPLQMYHCHGYASNGAPQRWQFQLQPDGTYRIFNQSNLLCLGTVGTSFGGRTFGNIEQRTCGGYPFEGENFRIVEFQPGNSFQLQSTALGLELACIGISSNGNDARVIWEACHTDAFQIFAFG